MGIMSLLTGPLVKTGIGVIGDVLDKIIPDKDERARAQERLSKIDMQQEFEVKMAEMDLEKTLVQAMNEQTTAQMAVNREEAKSPSLFKSGWRPAVGWICVAALGYSAIIVPTSTFFIRMYYPDVVPPEIDTATTMEILFGMLGMGGMRTYEKLKGVASGYESN